MLLTLRPNISVEPNRRPATSISAVGQFAMASSPPRFVSAAVAHLGCSAACS